MSENRKKAVIQDPNTGRILTEEDLRLTNSNGAMIPSPPATDRTKFLAESIRFIARSPDNAFKHDSPAIFSTSFTDSPSNCPFNSTQFRDEDYISVLEQLVQDLKGVIQEKDNKIIQLKASVALKQNEICTLKKHTIKCNQCFGDYIGIKTLDRTFNVTVCGHTYCSACAQNLLKYEFCPMCMGRLANDGTSIHILDV